MPEVTCARGQQNNDYARSSSVLVAKLSCVPNTPKDTFLRQRIFISMKLN